MYPNATRFSTGARPALATALFAVIACGPSDQPAGHTAWRATVDTVGDTVVVHTMAGSVWGDTATLEPRAVIGVAEGAEEYLIGRVGALAVAGDGSVYVLDTQIPVVRVYDRNGTYLHDIGRKGGGPGEYKRPGGIAVLPDGRVLVRDPGNARISVYEADGTYLEQWWTNGTFNTSEPLRVDTAGYTYTLVLLNPGTVPWEWIRGLARYGPDGTVVDTLLTPAWDYEPARVTAQRENSSSSNSVPFSPAATWTFSPLGYFVGGVSTHYRIDLFRPDGVLRLERDTPPIPVQRAEAAERRRQIVENFKQGYGSWRWNGPPIPDTKPPFRDLMTSAEGNIWVLVSRPGRVTMTEAEAREEEARSNRVVMRFREPVAFDVFDRDGRFLGPVRGPEDMTRYPEPVIRGRSVWAVTRDDEDVPHVVRFELVLPATNP